MKRVAWAIWLLAACRDSGDRTPRERVHVEEVDQLPTRARDDRAAVAPRAPARTVDQVLECFGEPITTAVPQSMSSITVGDFDGDGRPDVVVTYETLQDGVFTGHVVTYRNAGDGRLVETASIAAGDMVYAVSSGDIDRDGKLDLAVGDSRGSRTRLYRGVGDGSFVEERAVASARKPYGATLVDVDGDGKLDLVTELFSHVQIYKGDGKFGFRKLATIATGQAPDGPVAADLDGDGVLDLGYAANDEGFWFTLAGPRWKLSARGETTCAGPAYASGGDWDGDGDVDMGWVCDDKIEVRLNDGKGRFEAVTYPFGSAEHPIVAGDFTGDGKIDLLTSQRAHRRDVFDASSKLVILEGLGGGRWREHAQGTVPIVNDAEAADLDGDGRLDIVLATWTGNRAALVVLLQQQDCRNAP